MTHDIDLALYLSGDVKRIASSGVKKRNKIKINKNREVLYRNIDSIRELENFFVNSVDK